MLDLLDTGYHPSDSALEFFDLPRCQFSMILDHCFDNRQGCDRHLASATFFHILLRAVLGYRDKCRQKSRSLKVIIRVLPRF